MLGMRQGLSLGHYQYQQLEQKQRLTQEQRLDQSQKLGQLLRNASWDLAEAFSDSKYTEHTVCSGCGHYLTRDEIMKGFTIDRTDIRTTCPKCGARPRAYIKNQSRNSATIEIPMYCPNQTLERLPHGGLDKLTPELFKRDYRDVFHSVKIHFGTLAAAYAREGLTYPHVEVLEWKEIVAQFLGNMSDALIADHAGVSTSTIARHRRSLGIKSFRKNVAEGLLERMF